MWNHFKEFSFLTFISLSVFAAVRLSDVLMIFQLNTQTQSTYRDVDLWMRESQKKNEKRFSFSPFHPLGGIIVKGREIARVKKN